MQHTWTSWPWNTGQGLYSRFDSLRCNCRWIVLRHSICINGPVVTSHFFHYKMAFSNSPPYCMYFPGLKIWFKPITHNAELLLFTSIAIDICRSSSYEGSVAKRHHLQAGRVSSIGSVSLAGATWSSLTTSSVPSEVQLPRSVDSCPQQLSTAGLSTANAFQNALDSASKAQRAAQRPELSRRYG